MLGRGFEKALGDKAKLGLTTRLASHASGRLSGDQFCVYVANRLVIPGLGADQLGQFADGRLTLEALTRQYICSRLTSSARTSFQSRRGRGRQHRLSSLP